MPEFTRVGAVKDFAEGLVRVFPVDGVDVGVVNYGGRFYAFSGRCPHENYLMNYTRIREGGRVLCSSHFAWFDLATGRVISGPTDKDLTQYEVRVEDGDVLVTSTPANAR
jgi:3-phenylpropionate/trans-cinnamate dioxygenase ferredoxin subunit